MGYTDDLSDRRRCDIVDYVGTNKYLKKVYVDSHASIDTFKLTGLTCDSFTVLKFSLYLSLIRFGQYVESPSVTDSSNK